MIRSAHQTGYILLPVIVVITLVAAIALLMNTESALESNTAGSELDAQQARYVAEAGLNHALWMAQRQGCGPYGNLTDEPLGNDKYTTALTTDLGSTSAFTISVDQDSWIRSDQPTINKATDLKLHTRNEAAGTERPLVRYDLSTIAAKAPILSATAWFYLTNAHAAGPIDLHLTISDWTETDATWDSMNANMDSAVLATIPAQSTVGIWISVNLTSQVQAWVNGQPNFGITLNSTVDGVHGQYNSRESANPPWLEVIVGTPPTSPALLKATGTLANGVTRDIMRNVRLQQNPSSYRQLQPDALLGMDAEIWDQSPNNNYGTQDETWVSSATNDTTRSMLRFNIDALPADARILGANLFLERESGSGADQPVSAHRITNPWSEDSVTWNERESGTDWDTAGGDFDNTAVATTPVGPANQRYAWNITPLVQGWVDGSYPNHGVALVAAITGMPGERFYTSDDADPSRWPSLSITYACACGEVCFASQGSGNVLMPVTSTSNPAPGELLRIALLESWGYVVNTTWQKNSPTNFNSAIAANDVVYVPSTVDPNEIDDKLTNATIGVVIEEGELTEELGLSSGQTWKVGDSINIVDNSHYITQIFPSGTLPIYSAKMEMLTVSGTEAAGLTTLADIGGAGSLVVLDVGDDTGGDIDGEIAAGRRVMLPLGRVNNFNLDQLNNNGRLIVKRAIEWGIGGDKVSVGNLLMVVANPGSLSAQEDSKKTLIESWDYTVTLIDDGDSQANFDTAAAASDVIYVSGSISGGALADKLTGSPMPIVSEFAGKLDNFGFSSNTGNTVTTDTFTTTNASHYIGQPFAGSAVTHFTTSRVMPVPSGTVAPGLISAASIGGLAWALPTLDTGAERWDGTPAPARRVHLPFGAAEANQLTDDGKTLMRRAIEWTMLPPNTNPQLLFVVQNPASLTSYETAKKVLIESWGYSVNLIDDDDSVTSLYNAYTANDVVYVSGEVSDSAVDSKLIKAPVGVVSEQIALHDELLLSTSADSNDFNRVLVINNSHYITEGIATGWHFIANSDQPLNALVGTLAPGMNSLAEVWITGANYEFGLAVVDTGGQLNTGEIAAGRRVQLPWGTAGFDFSALNDNGKNLMRRAIEWAGGWDGASEPLVLSTDNDATLGGLDFTDIDLAQYNPGMGNASLFFDGSLTTLNADIDAIHVLENGHIVLSPKGSATLGGESFEDGDLVDYDPVADSATLVFDGSALFTDPTEKIVSVFVMDNGHLILSTDSDAELGGVSFTDKDLVEYNPETDSASLFFDGSLTTLNVDITALHVLDNGHLILAGKGNPDVTLGGLTFQAGDLVDYDPVADSATLIFDGDALFTDPLEKLNSVHVGTGSGTGVSAPVTVEYTELYEPWTAATPNIWETVSLASLGVPANVVVEVAVENDSTSREREAGVRAVGSGLGRTFDLHEAENGGVDAIVLHVQTDASSQIQHFAENTGDITFRILGYWTGAAYVDLQGLFTASASGSWQTHSLTPYGVTPGQVVEIVMQNTNGGNEYLAGARKTGSGIQRRFDLHEAENGGKDYLSLFVEASSDAAATIEVYAENNGEIEFKAVGAWVTPPGSYTETGNAHGQVSSPTTWETIDLTSFGVPANSVAQFVMANERDGQENQMGVREIGSTINNRRHDLQEAEQGGSDLGSMHVNVDASSQVQWAAEYGATEGYFYPVGWWVLSP